MNIETITANALVPEELMPYVQSISGVKPKIIEGIPCLVHEKSAVIIAFQPQYSDTDIQACIHKLSRKPAITVLSQRALSFLPTATIHAQDIYLGLNLPYIPSKKLQYTQKRALREIYIAEDTFTSAHKALIEYYCLHKNLDEGTKTIFQNIPYYVEEVPKAKLYSAYHSVTKALQGFVIIDFSAKQNAFYMFALRHAQAIAGTSDALLLHAVHKAEEYGYAHVNLGLNIHAGIEFFKHKYKATPCISYIETHITQEKQGFSLISFMKSLLK